MDNVALKPLVKHVLSKESQELFAKLSSALIDETNSEWRNAALASIRSDPGIHQLTTYLITFFAEKVTHNLNNLFILTQMMHGIESLLQNPTLYLDPYIAHMVPPVLTCCIAKRLGPAAHPIPSAASSETMNGNNRLGQQNNSVAHFELRSLAASILTYICSRYEHSSTTLKARIARSCLKDFMDPNKGLGSHFGALTALLGISGGEGMRLLILPNLKLYDELLKEAYNDESKKPEADRVLATIMKGLDNMVRRRRPALNGVNGFGNLGALREQLVEQVGDVVANRIVASERYVVAQAVLETDLKNL